MLGPALVRRALDDLSAIGDAARRLPALESGVVGGLSRLESQLDALRDEVSPIQELHEVREGIEPLDDDLHRVRQSIDRLEPVVKQLAERLGSADDRIGDVNGRIEALRAELSPVGELADKVPGVGRR
jgi:chromosome segregation ATPase